MGSRKRVYRDFCRENWSTAAFESPSVPSDRNWRVPANMRRDHRVVREAEAIPFVYNDHHSTPPFHTQALFRLLGTVIPG
jgi:hypothetical protein